MPSSLRNYTITRAVRASPTEVICYLVMLISLKVFECKNIEEYDPKQEQVVVRAVFINCEANEEQSGYIDSDATRFQREELYKHSALQGCRRKLALTVKITNEPEKSSGDEYIPIEHVFDGSNKKRARLLDPYILRLRRDPPLQAYKLRRIDTVAGILSNSDEQRKNIKSRIQRNLEHVSIEEPQQEVQQEETSAMGNSESEMPTSLVFETEMSSTESIFDTKHFSGHCDTSTSTSTENIVSTNTTRSTLGSKIFQSYDQKSRDQALKTDECTFPYNPAWRRDKRHEHNIIVEDIIDDQKIPWNTKDHLYKKPEQISQASIIEEISHRSVNKKKYDHTVLNERNTKNSLRKETHLLKKRLRTMHHHTDALRNVEQNKNSLTRQNAQLNSKFPEEINSLKNYSTRSREIASKRNLQNIDTDTLERDFVMYEIAKPEFWLVWYTIKVQLFEKMSTDEGKTVWNDITKGEVASVSAVEPEWMGQDINVKYRPTDWTSKEEFTLSSTGTLCLLVPMRDKGFKKFDDDTNSELIDMENYIVVPKDDIVGLEEETLLLNKRSRNDSDLTSNSERDEHGHRKVLVRVSRALMKGNEEMKIMTHGSDRFLTLPYRRSFRAQIDVEARADENELIRVGSSGSLMTIVADNSRRTRSVITIKASNRGLAAARFRVKTRDCGPELANLLNDKMVTTGPVLIAPRHTQRFHLELPVEIPTEIARCTVQLTNDYDEPVAVREVVIKKGDRCFCVWHCDCVCLNEDPKLLCREMPESRQTAAGLSVRDRPRHARSACYPDVATLNLCVIIIGVLMALLFLGLLKAFFGLFCRCLAVWGLGRLVQMPRKLDHYYETNLRDRVVVYDNEGWPVHPDTKKRCIHYVSPSMEFFLNIIFFVAAPSIMLWDAIKRLKNRATNNNEGKTKGRGDEKCFSTHDMQSLRRQWRRRRAGLQKWMTPPAEELSKDIWSKGLTPPRKVECNFMTPLLDRRDRMDDPHSSCVDSEQDDTEYVLMQMQKSKESLAKSQRKLTESGQSTMRKQQSNDLKAANNTNR